MPCYLKRIYCHDLFEGCIVYHVIKRGDLCAMTIRREIVYYDYFKRRFSCYDSFEEDLHTMLLKDD
jgi:hypothetical protein